MKITKRRDQKLHCSIKISPVRFTSDINTIRTNVLHALSFRAVPKSTENAMLRLFEKRMTPSLACAEMKHSLYKQSNDEDEYEKKLADWAFMPRKSDFKNLYKEFNQQLYGERMEKHHSAVLES